jgi:Uma2 family endonuclease
VERPHSSTRLTYADYVLFPDDGLRHEIIDGEHYVTPSPVTRHQRISRELLHVIHGYLETDPIGEVFGAPFDVVLSDTNVLVPDLVYVSDQRAKLLTEKNLQGPPDLVIEILSPGTRSRDEQLKRDVYERAGVEEYWLIDPERNAVRVYRRGAAGFLPAVQHARPDTLTTSLLPGFKIPLEKIFR